MAQSKIEWLYLPGYKPETWNYFSGCSHISAGCNHCWAEGMSKRMSGRYGYPIENPFKPTIHPDKLMEPYTWKQPRMVFVTSMGDTFHEDFSFDEIHKMFDVMEAEENQKHLFLVLTKRARRMQMFFRDRFERNNGKVAENIWAGVSIESQKQANKRLFYLMMTNAQKLFVSAEPLLEPIDFNIVYDNYLPINTLTGIYGKRKDHQGPKLDWVIVGGESGPHARPMHPDWVRSIRDQCAQTNTPFFFKQWGAWAPTNLKNAWKPNQQVVCSDGKTYAMTLNKSAVVMEKVGKKAAGRVLDSEVYQQYPHVQTRFIASHSPKPQNQEGAI
jgi:protein gp37